MVMGCLRGRDSGQLISALGPERLDLVIACRPQSPHAQEPEVVADAARELGLVAEVSDDRRCAASGHWSSPGPEDLVLVTGSLYLVGAARSASA